MTVCTEEVKVGNSFELLQVMKYSAFARKYLGFFFSPETIHFSDICSHLRKINLTWAYRTEDKFKDSTNGNQNLDNLFDIHFMFANICQILNLERKIWVFFRKKLIPSFIHKGPGNVASSDLNFKKQLFLLWIMCVITSAFPDKVTHCWAENASGFIAKHGIYNRFRRSHLPICHRYTLVYSYKQLDTLHSLCSNKLVAWLLPAAYTTSVQYIINYCMQIIALSLAFECRIQK